MSNHAKLVCEDLAMKYPTGNGYALGDASGGVSFDVAPGELLALLGPSGCGKTTTLRIIAGFLSPTRGTVSIGGTAVTRQPPHARPTNTVFQNYALFPHLNVQQNVEYGLKVHRVPKADRVRRAQEALEMMSIADFAKSKVADLSGGQAQRVALARAIVNRPDVLLLDEPLGALDLKLRRQMQEEIVRVKQESDRSFVHVTHDQEEACAMADRIAVMNKGRIIQIDTPVNLYEKPLTTFVAEFLGAGTVIEGSARHDADVTIVDTADVEIRGRRDHRFAEATPIAAVIPPNRIRLHAEADPAPRPNSSRGEIDHVSFTGTGFSVGVKAPSGQVFRALVDLADTDSRIGIPAAGQSVTIEWNPEDVIFVRVEGHAPEAEDDPLTLAVRLP